MTILRVVLRRGLVYSIEPTFIEDGYDLDTVAREITGCDYWSVADLWDVSVSTSLHRSGWIDSRPGAFETETVGV
jgi:hypothetical protein